ncbi:uroporphyrinogen-III C-methyltransferase [Pectobacterium aquaticum]|uniref:uroporphyrinogen-III C-methyltransferase n=1 Tax=Pectobacterium aquaticum TaxID=2204145 RepID=UPI000C7EE7BB|nr:uroporphyrinogen-III C-methyltransferase [Pectobacterium aquaticum]PLY38426.1 uroporphyrinogen-III C-methyltransferase [Pectobacterium carotovorum]MCH5049109.1 uroporphyrinogen-III C-methyltransferase [Pectobacterium aquaticum]RRO00270.1 uroporphyrinogen-III C-methyltransferase [Pectobacterium aquaticum]RRO10059.1 uroporphyrinogen-III C-methyltransferase [Pectobacterium aquaticum]UEM39201.1 uroporphyrinogen-III C-methyltransferase [Pectobacterium aquaticum]
MTEHNTPTAPSDEVAERVEPVHQQQDPAPQPKRSGAVLGAIAIVIALAIGAGLYYHGHQQAQKETAALQRLEAQLNTLQQRHKQEQQQWLDAQQQQSKAQETAAQRLEALTRQSDELRDKLAALSSHDTNTWLIAQADFLVKLAGRKLWSDKDVTTAGALLKSADASLAEMNDPSLIEIRRALTNDIGALAGVSQVDFDGIILKVNQLTDQLDNLQLADNNTDEAPMDANSTELSASLSEWRQNLSKSWHNFLADFITIRRRDSAAEPLLAPNQDVYLRENIRSRLLVAAQAIPRHQNEVYKQSLETAATWVRAYFDTTDPTTQAFLDQLDALSQHSVSLDVPMELQSQALLEKLMQTRVRNLLAQAPATQQGE